MSSRGIFLDLDRTLLDTDAFNHGHWQLIEQWCPEIDAKAELLRQNDFRVFDRESGMNHYDFTTHLGALGLQAAKIYEQLRNSELADGRLEYPGAAELIKWAKQQGDVNILTYGHHDYQKLKYDLCPSLAGVNIIVTLQPKGEFFRQNAPAGEAWLVDDKPIGDQLPAGVNFIQTAGYNSLEVGEQAWPVARSLMDVIEIVRTNTN